MIKSKYVDKTEYNRMYTQLKTQADDFVNGFAALKNEGLPISLDFIREHGNRDQYKKYWQSQANKLLDEVGGALAEESERYDIISRIRQKLEDTLPIMEQLSKSLAIGNIEYLEVDGMVSYQDKELKEMAMRFATFHIRAKELNEYYLLVKEAFDIHMKVEEYAQEHKFPNVLEGVNYWDGLMNPKSMTLKSLFLDDKGSEEVFTKALLSNSIKK